MASRLDGLALAQAVGRDRAGQTISGKGYRETDRKDDAMRSDFDIIIQARLAEALAEIDIAEQWTYDFETCAYHIINNTKAWLAVVAAIQLAALTQKESDE